MFGKNEKKSEEAKANPNVAVNYDIKVDEVRRTKKDNILMVDLIVNGVWIKSCMLKEVICQKDGDVHKKGDICYVLQFPSEKSGNKYYNRAWFPVSNENIEEICKQVQSLL